MQLIDLKRKASADGLAKLRRVSQPEIKVSRVVAKILREVREEGDDALVRLTKELDGVSLTPRTLRVTKRAKPPAIEVQQDMRHALANIRMFSEGGIPRDRSLINEEGARVAEQFKPFRRVGIYVPGGTAPLVSTVLMTVGIAKTAGVEEIVVTTPPPLTKELHFALELAGATEIYQVGGAQAIAALAYGTARIAPVQKIFGPGNAYVVEAKRQIFGVVSIDLLPGPSEIAIVADADARADFIAADLLAQAEHGSGSQILFLTEDAKLMQRVQDEIARQIKSLKRQKFLKDVLEHHAIFVLTRTIQQAVDLVEQYAPEHLSIFTVHADSIARNIRNAGAVFVGSHSPVAGGDYLAGPSHTLPTGGAGKSFAGLTIDQFFKRVSLVQYDEASIRRAAPMIARLAELEQLDAHAASARIRLTSNS